MQMNPYLNFKGDCEAAFQFYERCLGAKLGPVFRYAGSPMVGEVPVAFREKIMHGSVTVGDQLLMGADVLPERYEVPKGFSLSLQIKSAEEAERVFRELGEGGEAVMPLAKTFWAERFGVLVDRFGIRWIINCEGA